MVEPPLACEPEESESWDEDEEEAGAWRDDGIRVSGEDVQIWDMEADNNVEGQW